MSLHKHAVLISLGTILIATCVQSFSAQTQQFTGVRFSLYPNVSKEYPPSMKQAVKNAVAGLSELGVSITPDDVSSCLIGPEPALFEALRLCFAQASLTSDGKPRNVSLQATFSAGCPGEDAEEMELLPPRTAMKSGDFGLFVRKAYQQPPRIAAQFAVYPLGSSTYMDTIYKVIKNAQTYDCWRQGKTHFCSMLDGDGNEVFEVLRESFEIARQGAGHVTMTVTLTANKNAWPDEDRSPPSEVFTSS